MHTLTNKRNFLKDESVIQAMLKRGQEVFQTEAKAIFRLCSEINHSFAKACQLLLSCEGRVVVTGMGKSGHIASKIAATFASTGTPAFFVHPAEASHGDLGMIAHKDVVLALSYSGETHELLTILPLVKRLGIPLITMTGSEQSTLAELSDVHLLINIGSEACPLGLAPTASTTASLVMGDALAIVLLELKGFTTEDFARSHPGGNLGRKLLLRIDDIMHKNEDLPKISDDKTVSDALVEMTKKRLGMTTVIKKGTSDCLVGIFTDGDLRRILDKPINIQTTSIQSVMSTNVKTIPSHLLAQEAVRLMEKHQINALPVLDLSNRLVGALNMHDLLAAGVM